MTKEEIKNLIKAFLIAIAICTAYICAINPQMLKDMLSWINL